MGERLTSTAKHLLRLINRDSEKNGYVLVSEAIRPIIETEIPPELVEFTYIDGVCYVSLTGKGHLVVYVLINY